MLAVAASPSPYWFVTRGTGAVALVLLTISVALGILIVRRTRFEGVPRFVFDALHRTASLLAVAFLVVHILTTILDGFVPVSVLDAFIPFHSAYRPIWLGLGAIGFDLILAVTITSLVRARLGYRAWRATHWLAYASWPVALVHGYGTGTDARTHWLLVLTGACVVIMLAAVLARVRSGWPEHLPARVSALGAAAVLPIGLLLWLPSGPLASGWARRAGTPASVLAAAHGSTVTVAAHGGRSSSSSATPISVNAPFRGTVHQSQLGPGPTVVDISLRVSDPQLPHVHIRIQGDPVQGGGVQMTSSQVSAGPDSDPTRYNGRVTALTGPDVQATVSDSAGTNLTLLARLQLGADGTTATGTLQASSQGGR